MNQGKYMFSQIISIISHKQFQTLVRRYKGDYKIKDFTCWKQFLCMVFGQLTHRESLSDTMLCLQANADKLYHLRIGRAVSKGTLSVANENRSYEIYQDLAMLLIKEAKRLYIGDSNLGIALQTMCLQLTPLLLIYVYPHLLGNIRSRKAGIKLHTQLDFLKQQSLSLYIFLPPPSTM